MHDQISIHPNGWSRRNGFNVQIIDNMEKEEMPMM